MIFFFLLFFIFLFIWVLIFIFRYVNHIMANGQEKKVTSLIFLFHYLFYNNVIPQGAKTHHCYLGFSMVGLYFVFQFSLHLVGWFGRIIVFFSISNEEDKRVCSYVVI